MNVSIFLAQLFSIVYVAVGLGILFDTKYYHKATKKMLDDPAVMYLGGALALVTGFVILKFHNIWVQDWQVIITILGVLSLVKGVVLLVFPKSTHDIYKKWLKKDQLLKFGSVAALLIGAVLGYYGFIV